MTTGSEHRTGAVFVEQECYSLAVSAWAALAVWLLVRSRTHGRKY